MTAFLLIAPVAWRTNAIAQSAPEDNSKAEQLVLHFPADSAIGIVYWRSRTGDTYTDSMFDKHWKSVGEARGDVDMPVA